MPGAAQLQDIWPHNMHLGRAKNGDVVRLEAWGAVDVAQLQSDWETGACLKTTWLFFQELQNMLLVELSHHEGEVRQVTQLVDASGLSTAHNRLLEFLEHASIALRFQFDRAHYCRSNPKREILCCTRSYAVRGMRSTPA